MLRKCKIFVKCKRTILLCNNLILIIKHPWENNGSSLTSHRFEESENTQRRITGNKITTSPGVLWKRSRRWAHGPLIILYGHEDVSRFHGCYSLDRSFFRRNRTDGVGTAASSQSHQNRLDTVNSSRKILESSTYSSFLFLSSLFSLLCVSNIHLTKIRFVWCWLYLYY